MFIGSWKKNMRNKNDFRLEICTLMQMDYYRSHLLLPRKRTIATKVKEHSLTGYIPALTYEIMFPRSTKAASTCMEISK